MPLSDSKAFELIQETLDSLVRSGVIQEQIKVTPETILLGSASPLDSLGFVTFATELEERVVEETGEDVFFALDEIGDFNLDNPTLTAEKFAKYIVGLKV